MTCDYSSNRFRGEVNWVQSSSVVSQAIDSPKMQAVIGTVLIDQHLPLCKWGKWGKWGIQLKSAPSRRPRSRIEKRCCRHCRRH